MISYVLLDIGGVLVSDPWESLLLSPGEGLADRMRLDRGRVRDVGKMLWNRYCTRESTEDEYWSELSEQLNVKLPRYLIDDLEAHLLKPNRYLAEIYSALESFNDRVGLVTDNTSFWFAKECELIGLDKYVNSDLFFLSFRLGLKKNSNSHGLFDVAAARVDASTALVVDDRDHNVVQARRRRFKALTYAMDDDPAVLLNELTSPMC